MAGTPIEMPVDAGQAIVEAFELLLEQKEAPLITSFYGALNIISNQLQALNAKAEQCRQLLIQIEQNTQP